MFNMMWDCLFLSVFYVIKGRLIYVKHLYSLIYGAMSVSALSGIEFGDNGGQKYLTEDNGVATATTEVEI